jgi:hypothetical protein
MPAEAADVSAEAANVAAKPAYMAAASPEPSLRRGAKRRARQDQSRANRSNFQHVNSSAVVAHTPSVNKQHCGASRSAAPVLSRKFDRQTAPAPERGPLKPGEMQVETPEWMKDWPEYKHVLTTRRFTCPCHAPSGLTGPGLAPGFFGSTSQRTPTAR